MRGLFDLAILIWQALTIPDFNYTRTKYKGLASFATCCEAQ